MSCDKQGATDLLSAYFFYVYSSDQTDLNLENLRNPFFDLPNNVFFSIDNVCRKLLALCSVWSVGPDGISCEFLFQLRIIIAYIFESSSGSL